MANVARAVQHLVARISKSEQRRQASGDGSSVGGPVVHHGQLAAQETDLALLRWLGYVAGQPDGWRSHGVSRERGGLIVTSQRKLTIGVQRSTSNVHRSLGRLKAKGLIAVQTSAVDTRISLTDLGATAYSRIIGAE